jgi:hypothetical protein
MRLCKTGLLACLCPLAAAQDASRALEEARDKILSQVTHLPKYVCVETIDRSYFSRPNPPDPPPSCEQLAIDRKKGRNRPKLDYTDRVRVAVTFMRDREIFSWTGSEPASYSVEDILNPGPIGTGAFAAHLIDVFSNPSVRFRLLGEAPEMVEYGFQVPVEASHYSVGAGAEWLATGYSGSFRIERETQTIGRFTVETDELPRQTSLCEISSTLEFGAATGGLTPGKSTTHDVLRDTSETDSVTTISDCREMPATSPPPKLRADAPLQPGIVLSLVFNAPIDSGVAAAGDVISATVIEAYSAETKAVEISHLKDATVSGRIVRVEHWMGRLGEPAYFVISVAFDTLQVNGVVSPFYAKCFGRPKGVSRPITRGIAGHGVRDWSGSFMFTTRAPHFVVEMPFYTKWLTTAPDAAN